MFEQITGESKVYCAFFNEIEIRYASYDPLDVLIHVS